MSFSDSIFIFGLALIIFGPKKLPEIGRQIGKLLMEFRRASNEFKMQIEDELRAAEQEERQKQLSTAAAESSGGLTVHPPSTGAPVSADSPAVSAMASAAAEPTANSQEPYSYPYPGSDGLEEAAGTDPAQPPEASPSSAGAAPSFVGDFAGEASRAPEPPGEEVGAKASENAGAAAEADELQTAAETTVSHHG